MKRIVTQQSSTMHSGYFHDLQHALSWRWTGDARAMRSSCLMSEHQTSWWVRHWSLDWSRITGQLRPYLDRSFGSLGSSVLCMVAVDVGDTWGHMSLSSVSEDYSGSSNSFEASQKAGDWRAMTWFANESQKPFWLGQIFSDAFPDGFAWEVLEVEQSTACKVQNCHNLP